jgi:hypothetical protein
VKGCHSSGLMLGQLRYRYWPSLNLNWSLISGRNCTAITGGIHSTLFTMYDLREANDLNGRGRRGANTSKLTGSLGRCGGSAR